MKWCALRILHHKAHTFHAEHIRNFMRVGNGGDSALAYREAGKFRGWQQATFNMHMGIDKAR